jgi:hypothetical protein
MNQADMELTCLEILCNGEDLLPIGVWETPIKRLAMKEYAVKVGNGYRITDKGKAFLAKSEGVPVEQVEALEPHRPDWVVTPVPSEMGEGLVVLRKNELTVSGYEAMTARWTPVVHGRMNEPDTVVVRGDVNGFLQAMLDAAWARGLRPTDVK